MIHNESKGIRCLISTSERIKIKLGKKMTAESSLPSSVMKVTAHLARPILEWLASSTSVQVQLVKKCLRRCVMEMNVKRQPRTSSASMITATPLMLLSLESEVCHVREEIVDTSREFLYAQLTDARLHLPRE